MESFVFLIGTLESFEKSEEKCESEMQIINQKRMKVLKNLQFSFHL